MDYLTKNELADLIHTEKGPCISIYMPTSSFGAETKQGPIKLKNLLSSVDKELTLRGYRPQERESLLQLPQQLVQDNLFWSNQREGLAIFISPEWSDYYKLPLHVPELAIVGGSFHVKPLLGLVSVNISFYVLALTKDRARLFAGRRNQLVEVDMGPEITAFSSDVEVQFPEKNLQMNTGGVIFSHSENIEKMVKEKQIRFYRLVQQKIQELLVSEDIPLVLAAVEQNIAVFREVNKYPLLLAENIEGNPDNISLHELQKKAGDIVMPFFAARKEAARLRIVDQKASGKISLDMNEIIPAAYHGRIETLFVPLDQQVWGTFNPLTGDITLADKSAAGNRDLLDFAAVQTVLKNGSVYTVTQKELPESETLVALLRY